MQELKTQTDLTAAYSEAGFAIIPLNGKVPLHAKWQDTKAIPGLTQKTFQSKYPEKNFGVVAGDQHLIIDIDVKKGDGKNSFRKLTALLELPRGWESDTFVVRTGSGGFHIYLSKPPDARIKKNPAEFPFIDFISGNMFVVGAGCTHPESHKTYDVIFRSPNGIAPAPAQLLKILQPIKTLPAPQLEKGFVDNDPANVERYTQTLANMPEVAHGARGNNCYVAACRGRELGLTEEKSLEILQAHYNGVKLVPPLLEQEIRQIVVNAYKYGQNHPGMANVGAIFKQVDTSEPEKEPTWDNKADGSAKPTLNNAVNYLLTIPELKDIFSYNAFSGNIEVGSNAPWFKQRGGHGPNLVDTDCVLLKYFLTRQVRVEFTPAVLWEAIIVLAHRRHFHPIRNYLNALKWDGKNRIDTWLIVYCNAPDTVYTRALSRKVLCAGVKRIFNPGCKWDFVLVLEGAQGIGKSTVCRILGRMWSGDILIDPHNKDTVATMMNKWVIELSEMAALRWAESNALKAFISREKDVARLSYERHAKDLPRQSIFIGTINPDATGFLSDATGNRRWWITQTSAPFKLIELENDCDQLWAEAAAGYKQELLYLTGEASTLQMNESVQRMPDNFSSKLIGQWMVDNPEVDSVALQDMLVYCGLNPQKAFRGDVSKVCEAMMSIGWFREKIVENGALITRFKRPVEEILKRGL